MMFSLLTVRFDLEQQKGNNYKIHVYEFKENVLINSDLFPIQRTEKFYHKMLNNPNLVK